jgi:hypothetical protein
MRALLARDQSAVIEQLFQVTALAAQPSGQFASYAESVPFAS